MAVGGDDGVTEVVCRRRWWCGGGGGGVVNILCSISTRAYRDCFSLLLESNKKHKVKSEI